MAFTLRSVLFAAIMALTAITASAKTIKPSVDKLSSGRDHSKNLGLKNRDWTISIFDASAPAKCDRFASCCSRFCQLDIKFNECPNAVKKYSRSCKSNFDNIRANFKEIFINGSCGGWSIYWEDDAVDGGRYITVEEDSTGNFYQYFVEGCKATEPVKKGSDPWRCTSVGGGCTARDSRIGVNKKEESS
ncbi:hypothetical protein FIE12Z_1411 [Fusarium flagelliforme]|uniref:Uncharacterized protein n=1 Tax=Fusarium flagelliforme TaxID=2675880 RepID=A0A395N2S2_9HYPO|nr:hypothetical protein FIE12Z_1411 [Fusarium flagelliforme]